MAARFSLGIRQLAAVTLLMAAPAGAVPPPPIARAHGPEAVCASRFAVRLSDGEHAEQYPGEFWVVSGAGFEIGIRTDLAGLEGATDRVDVPPFGAGARQRVREWPGNHYRGWIYAFPLEGGATLRIASDQFQGTRADSPLLQRVLVGRARDALCRPAG